MPAGSDRDDPAREADHADRLRAIRRRPVPELATLVRSPTSHSAPTGQGARVEVAGGDGHHLRSSHRYGRRQ